MILRSMVAYLALSALNLLFCALVALLAAPAGGFVPAFAGCWAAMGIWRPARLALAAAVGLGPRTPYIRTQ